MCAGCMQESKLDVGDAGAHPAGTYWTAAGPTMAVGGVSASGVKSEDLSSKSLSCPREHGVDGGLFRETTEGQRCKSSTEEELQGKETHSGCAFEGWGCCVPSEEELHAELRTFELLTQLRTAARKWALHDDNFFFHWNRLRLEWRDRTCSVAHKSQGLADDASAAKGLEAKGSAVFGQSKDSVDTLW